MPVAGCYANVIGIGAQSDKKLVLGSTFVESGAMKNRTSLGILVAACMVTAACASSVLTLDTGTCFDDPESFEEVTDVPVVDCSESHDNEVIGSFDLPAGEYPGDPAVASGAEEGCLARFEPYVGTDYPSSAYDLGWFTPTSDSWDAGDREVICFVYDVTLAKIIGSVAGSAG